VDRFELPRVGLVLVVISQSESVAGRSPEPIGVSVAERYRFVPSQILI
jgi:hypothetical protein